ncbi:MAG: hypothetical protein ACE5LS_03530 [Thermoplasmata archaeon]
MRNVWAWNPSKEGNAQWRREAELAHYFELEYGEGEVHRLMAEARAAGRPAPGHLRTRQRRPVAKKRRDKKRGSRVLGHVGGAPTAVPRAAADVHRAAPKKDAPPRRLPNKCRHEEWETLGSGGNATYLQCLACGALVVNQGGRLWSFSRDQSEGI